LLKATSHHGSKILVCNSISQLDSLILESIDNLVLVSRTQQLPSFLHWLMGYPDFASCSLSQISSKFTSYCSCAEPESPVLVFPEETTSSGSVGILKFSTWPFDTSLAYQPIVLKAKRFSLLPIKLSVVDGSFWSDFLWSLFVPYTIFHVRYLPEMRKEEPALVEDFAKSVQKKMAESLGVHPSQFDFNDKKEFMKRIKHESEERSSPSVRKIVPQQQRPQSTSKIDKMVQQVKDVLPQVPISVIRKDILKSKSVDATLANILEGNVPYTPLTSEEIQTEKGKQLEKRSASVDRQVNPAQNLPDSTKSLSYQEKKKLMIDEARRRYLEKHPEYLE